jgi:dienelactone hydrolase
MDEPTLTLLDGARTAGGVHTRPFEVSDGERSERVVPGLLWTPVDARGGRPLVLIGHGAGGSKAEGYVVSLARRLVTRAGYAVAAIDGPVHGDRRVGGAASGAVPFLEFSQLWSRDPTMTDTMIADWRATLDTLLLLDEVGRGPVGWWGLSMGTILGLPFVAGEPRIQAAVLGLMGMTGPTRERIRTDAPRVRCPVLYLVQWDDELFDRGASFELFDALGSGDKHLHANLGRHGEVPDEEFEASAAFLVDRLGGALDPRDPLVAG